MTNRQKFIESYARRMRTHWACNPLLYAEPMPESFVEQAEKNILDYFTFGRDPGIIMRMTMREYGLAQTYDSLKNFLTADTTSDILSHE